MLPGSKLIVFEDAAHLHHLEKSAEFESAVRAFLRRNDAARKP